MDISFMLDQTKIRNGDALLQYYVFSDTFRRYKYLNLSFFTSGNINWEKVFNVEPRAYTEINLGEGNMCEAQTKNPPLRASRGGGQNLNRKFKTFGILDTLKVHIVQLTYKDYFISPSNQTSRLNIKLDKNIKNNQIMKSTFKRFQFKIRKSFS